MIRFHVSNVELHLLLENAGSDNGAWCPAVDTWMEHTLQLLATGPTVYPFIHDGQQPRLYSNSTAASTKTGYGSCML